MIKTFTGPMYASKTAAMINVYNKIWNKEHVVVFKPKCDDRDLGIMKSRDYEEGIPAFCIEDFEEIVNHIDANTRTIFVDEAQLIKGDVNILSFLSIGYDMDIYVSGLNMTSEQEPFLTMPQILAISDEVEVIKASCYDCGREASYSYYDGEKTETIKVGDSGYFPLCRKCLLKRVGRVNLEKRLIKNKKML